MHDVAHVLDAHVHFWDPSAFTYAWLSTVPTIRRPFAPSEHDGLASGVVTNCLAVEANGHAGEAQGEIAYFASLAESEPRIHGCVAYADLTDEGTRKATMERLAADDFVVGIRQNVQGRASGFATSRAFTDGVRALSEHGLRFDLCATADQLEEVGDLLTSCPGTQFVLDHGGKPAIRDDRFASWASDIERIAAHDHVVCKLSGLLTEARPDQWNADSLRPYVDHLRVCFGAQRLLYGSDWPVVNLAGGEPLWRTIVSELVADWSPAERNALYHRNATRVYGVTERAH